MPSLKPGHISPTPEEDAEIDAAIASDPDTREVTGSCVRRWRTPSSGGSWSG